jgi:hypothetical protein
MKGGREGGREEGRKGGKEEGYIVYSGKIERGEAHGTEERKTTQLTEMVDRYNLVQNLEFKRQRASLVAVLTRLV